MNLGNKKNIRKFTWGLIVFLIISNFVSFASADEYSEYQWDNGISKRLQLGDTISYNGFTVEVVMFSSPVESEKYSELPKEEVQPFVELNISRNGIFLNKTILEKGQSYVVSGGELRVIVRNLPSIYSPEWLYESYDPWADVELNQMGTPELEIRIDPENNEYFYSAAKDIMTTVTVKNKGTADIFNVDVAIGSDLNLNKGELNYHYDLIKNGGSFTNTIVFSSPAISEKKSFNISAKMSGKNVKNTQYSAESLKTISISPDPFKMPIFRKYTNPKIYLKDSAIVTLSFRNNENFQLNNLTITDYLPENFELVGNNSLKWEVNIGPNGEWNAHYFIKPVKPYKDGTLLPSADAEFRFKGDYYIVKSEKPEIVVNGPFIELNKKADVSEINPGDTVTVTVTAINSGNTPTEVFIKDELPEKATMIDGNTTYKEYLLANKEVSFSYIIKIDSEIPFTLPSVAADYYELGKSGNKIRAVGEGIGINIISKIPTNENTSDQTQIVEQNNNSMTQIIDMTEIIEEPAPSVNVNETLKTPVELDDIFNILLGCDETIDENHFNGAYIVCSFIN